MSGFDETSAPKVSANRRNALKSTGPKTALGKARSSRNAVKHGLAAAGMRAADMREVENISVALAGPNPSVQTLVPARAAAEATVELRRVAEVRGVLWTLMDQAKAGAGEKSEMSGLLNQLRALERYERRAFSRRKKALRQLPLGDLFTDRND